jgi:hypothetical protein
MMKNMKQEDLEKMRALMNQGSAMGGVQPNISQMLRDPSSMQSMMASMQAMSEDDLAGMLKMTKPNMSDEEARTYASACPVQCTHFSSVNLHKLSVVHEAMARWLYRCPTRSTCLQVCCQR